MSKPHKKIGVGNRCALWLRTSYKLNKGKAVARDFNVSENTAWLWMSGKTPSIWHLEAMVARWGRPFLEYIFKDVTDPSEPIERILEIRAELSRRDLENDNLEGSVPSGTKDTGRFFIDASFIPYDWYEASLSLIPRDKLATLDRARLVFEIMRTYQQLITWSKAPAWYEPIVIRASALASRVFRL